MQGKELKQDEIDALFMAVQSREEAAPRSAEDSSRVVPYSFSSSGQISNEQMRAISMLNDLFARNLTHNLGAWLRTRLQVSLVSAEQITFNEFLLRIPEIAYMASVRLEPLGAVSILQLDLGLASPIIDLLLGGDGKQGQLRELTDIEESILASVVEIICRELTSAWQPVGLNFNFERRQMQTQVARAMAVTERTLCLGFEMRLHDSVGILNLAFPAVVANTILRRLTTEWVCRRHGSEARVHMERLARQIHFGCSLQLPRVRIPASVLDGLQQGMLLRLNVPASSIPLLNVGGKSLFEARPVQQRAHRAARVERRLFEENGGNDVAAAQTHKSGS